MFQILTLAVVAVASQLMWLAPQGITPMRAGGRIRLTRRVMEFFPSPFESLLAVARFIIGIINDKKRTRK